MMSVVRDLATRGTKSTHMNFFVFFVTSVLSVLCFNAQAQGYPSKTIAIVVPFTPGTGADVIARLLQPKLAERLRVPVVIENKVGASGAIGTEYVAKAEPDGYTLLFTATSHGTLPAMKRSLPYDPVKSFTPVSLVGRYVYVLVAAPSLPAKDVNELLAHARANPGKLSYGSYSGVTQLMHNQLKLAGAETTLVPYKGEGPAVTDILGNHIQFTFATPASTLQHVKEGKLRAMAVLLPSRSALLPDVPTAAEAGLPPFAAGTWAALFGPAKLPAEIAQRMNRELQAAMKRTDVRDRIAALGFELAGSTPDELGTFVQDQLQAWGRAFRDAGMTPE